MYYMKHALINFKLGIKNVLKVKKYTINALLCTIKDISKIKLAYLKRCRYSLNRQD